MKTLIIYATRYGATKKCATLLAEALREGADLVNLAEHERPNLLAYDMIVVGGPIYEDHISSKVHRFCKKYKSVLLEKQVAFFICQTSVPSTVQEVFADNFDEDLLNIALAKATFGGEVNWEQLTHADRLLLGKETYRHIQERHSEIHSDKIKSFALALDLHDEDYHIDEV